MKIAAVRRVHAAIQPFVLGAKRQLGPRIQAVADIGCGNGIMSALIMQDIRPDRAMLIDIENRLEVPIGGAVWFKQLDVCAGEFVTDLRDRVHMATCLFTFHEFADPLTAVRNIAAILPRNAGALIIDRSEEGWYGLSHTICGESARVREHYEQDLAMIARTGLGKDDGIREFWEDKARPSLPGTLIYGNVGTAYTVLYVNNEIA
ncbi:MAG TPA: class I SAM-dependent methyltransferase [Candidatus Paceibacterota bacterium]|jgi:hypothetical protein